LSKHQRQEYLESRATEAEEMTAEAAGIVASLRGILEASPSTDPAISFNALKLDENLPEFVPPRNLAVQEAPPNQEDFVRRVKPASFFERLFGLRKSYEHDLGEARSRFTAAHSKWLSNEADRLRLLANLKTEHDAANREKLIGIQERNAEVAQLEAAYGAGEPAAVTTYCAMVFERSQYSNDFPHEARLAYIPGSKELVIDYELPLATIVPIVAEYRYVKSKDTIEEKARKTTEIKEVYRDLVAAVTLRTLHELFRADQGAHLDVIVCNQRIRSHSGPRYRAKYSALSHFRAHYEGTIPRDRSTSRRIEGVPSQPRRSTFAPAYRASARKAAC
jgi:restriction system protein